MPNGRDPDPFPLPPIFPPPRPIPTPRPRRPERDPRRPGVPPTPLPPTTAQPVPVIPLPTGGQGFPIPKGPGGVTQLPLPGANEPFGGKVIRIGRVLKGVGLGTVLIIGAEILVEVLTRKQLRKMGEILERQDAEIAQAQIERLEERARQKEVTIRPGRFELPEIGGAEIEQVTPEIPAEIPAPTPRPRPLPGEEFPEIILPTPAPVSVPEVPVPVALPEVGVPGQTPGTFPAPAPQPLPAPIGAPLPLPSPAPIALPTSFPVSPPIATPITTPIGDPFPLPLTPIQPRVITSGFIDLPTDPQPQPEQDPARRCQEVRRRRRKKGKCREGFFIERPGKTEFITWRERECDTGLFPDLEVVK